MQSIELTGDEDDYQPTGLERLIGPVAPHAWDAEDPGEDTAADVEWMRRKDWADAVREQAERDKRAQERAAAMAERSAIIADYRAGKLVPVVSSRSNWMPGPANDNQRSTAIDGESLMALVFDPVKYVVPGYIAEGLTLLGGRPKLGKSWLALDFCIAVASGGFSLGVHCQQGDAIYFALEDNRRRLQDRLRTVLPKSERPDISRLTLETEAPKVNAGLIARLDAWRTKAQDPRLVIVDTFAMVRPQKGKNQDSYAADYEALSPLQRWASEHRIALVVVTHVRKMEAEDPLESISGTNGLTGAADAILVLNRTSDGPKLYGRGRDVEEVEKALRFDAGRWSVLGDVTEAKRSDERKAIMGALAAGNRTPGEVAKATGKTVSSVQYLIGKMVAAGEAEKSKFGLYTLPSESSDSSE